MLNGGGGADGSSGGVVNSPPGIGSVVLKLRAAPTVGEGVEDGREPGVLDAITSSSSTFFHSAWRVKGIIPSILHHVLLVEGDIPRRLKTFREMLIA